MKDFPQTLDDLDDLVQEVERKGFRIRFLDPHSDDPLEYKYLPSPNCDGVKEIEVNDLVRKAEKVAIIRKWTDITVVGPDLEPVSKATSLPNTLKSTSIHVGSGAIPSQINNDDLTVDEILAQARIGVPKSELPKSQFAPFDEDDPFDRMSELVAKEHQVPLTKLRRIAIAEDIDGVENLRDALVQIAESIKAGG